MASTSGGLPSKPTKTTDFGVPVAVPAGVAGTGEFEEGGWPPHPETKAKLMSAENHPPICRKRMDDDL
jgi:hypothetical protein